MKNPLGFSVEEVAAMMGMDPRHVRHLCQLGRISPATKIMNMWVIDPAFTVLRPEGYVQPAPDAPKKRGRPKGVKNFHPYPQGVKRPLKKPPELDKRRKQNKGA